MIKESKSVLVVEDNPALATVMQFNFSRAGFDVTVARDGQAALQHAVTKHFDAIVTDEQMPRLNGTELCRRLRTTIEYAVTPVVMVTAKRLEMDLQQLREELGITATLAKPFSPAELVSTVERCIEQCPAVSTA